MKISIAMATYNGSRYLGAQLESFLAQTRLPDELVVVDDGSMDGTLECLEKFSSVAPFIVKIIKHSVNKGYIESFGEAIANSTGDLIFLSDQDDSWKVGRLEAVEKVFETDSSVYLLVNDADITDSSLTPCGETKMGARLNLVGSLKEHATGCCTVMRSDLKGLLLPIPATGISHDVWAHLVARLLGGRRVLDVSLQYVRRHENNTSDSILYERKRFSFRRLFGVCRLSNPVEDVGGKALAVEEFIQRVNRMDDSIPSDRSVRDVNLDAKYYLDCLHDRCAVLKANRGFRVLLIVRMYLYGKYGSFNGWKTALKDVLARRWQSGGR